MRTRSVLAVGVLVCFAAGCASTAPEESATKLGQPLPHAHAHNDYEHERPLFDALSYGFCSIEADVHVVDGQLLVAHDREDVRPGHTLESLYLGPLRELARRNGGRVYPDGPTITLLIDFKTPAVRTYEALKPLLVKYKEMLTEFREGDVETRAVTVIISGNRPVRSLQQENVRYAAIDGRLQDLETNPPAHLVPLVSDNWATNFEWRGSGGFPVAEAVKLRDIVQKAHAQGRKVRFWATPDRPPMWDALLAAEVDLIGADNLERLAGYLKECSEDSP
ncbi:MAG: phosphatidylinositol-specific phospholipase C/glycerophosphodiester phosphodiesterase family protein [Candidatus Hydrogenedentota bacterium]